MGKITSGIENTTMAGWQAPIIFDAGDASGRDKLEKLIRNGEVESVHDEIRLALNELFDIENPEQKDTKTDAQLEEFARGFGEGDLDHYGRWVYFPWDHRLVH